MQPNRFAWSTQ